ncbi:MAG TPA: cytochrome ubiquinol oxidase subunit I, partial [Candidatus Onthomorpha intestinigallinarum]|nr:cytochrome ubiquinol oxidase subunit I [Candidatus Onthomorpha intestinigallinarum]
LYKGGTSQDLVAVGLLNPDKKTYDDGKKEFLFRISIPNMLSFLATRDFDGYVPGISDIIEGGYTDSDNQRALSFEEKQLKGRQAINSLALYRQAKAGKDTAAMNIHAKELNDNIACFGYGYIDKAEDSVPNVPLCFYSFRVMVLLGAYFVVFFALMLFLSKRDMLHKYRWTQYLAVVSIFLAYITAQSGWIVAEAGRQPWAIQDILPVGVGVSSVSISGVQTTFMIFAILFTVMLSAMIGIMVKQIRKGPQN